MKVFMESFVTIVAFAYVFVGGFIIMKYSKEAADYPQISVQVIAILMWPIILGWAAVLAFKEVIEEKRKSK